MGGFLRYLVASLVGSPEREPRFCEQLPLPSVSAIQIHTPHSPETGLFARGSHGRPVDDEMSGCSDSRAQIEKPRTPEATERLSVSVKIRLDVALARTANRAAADVFDIAKPRSIWPPIYVNADRVLATIVAATDQQASPRPRRVTHRGWLSAALSSSNAFTRLDFKLRPIRSTFV